MFVFGTGKNTGHEDAMPADGTFLAALPTNEMPAHPVLTAALGRSSRPTSSYIRSAARPKDRAGWRACPILVRVIATGHLIGVGGLHIRDFYHPARLCLRSVARHFAAPRPSTAAIDQT